MQPHEIKANLTKRIKEAKDLSAYHKAELDKDPEDFGLRLRFNSFKTIVEDLEKQLIAHEAFDCGWNLFQKRKQSKAIIEFRKSIELMPSYAGFLHNQLGFNARDDWETMIKFMKFLLKVQPNYVLAKKNLVIAYVNYGIEQARNNLITVAIRNFLAAQTEAENHKDLVDLTNKNLAAAYTELGILKAQTNELEEVANCMLKAFSHLQNNITRDNAEMALGRLALNYLQTNQFTKAVEAFKKLENFFGLLPEIKNDYAIALACTKQIKEAITVLEKTIQHTPNLPKNINDTILSNLLVMKEQQFSLKNILYLSPTRFASEKANIIKRPDYVQTQLQNAA